MKWTRNKDSVLVSYENKVVRVLMNKSFYYYVKNHPHPFASLSISLHQNYKKKQGKRLHITYRSLAYEIAIHYYTYLFCTFKALTLKLPAPLPIPAIRGCEFMILFKRLIVENVLTQLIYLRLFVNPKKIFKAFHKFHRIYVNISLGFHHIHLNGFSTEQNFSPDLNISPSILLPFD
ncbi:MAG: hypothetical protein ACLRZ7_04845 [Lachnospiraceae bacterium]